MNAPRTSRRRQAAPVFDVERVRADFPILAREVHGEPLVYLDSAASAQKPSAVIDTVRDFDATTYSNVHRGVHYLSEKATEAFEGAREKVRQLLNAAEAREILFVRGTTEAINLVAHGYGRPSIEFGDEIILSTLEHHSNIVPWQMLCEEKGATLRVIPIDDRGQIDLEAYVRLLGERTKLVAVIHVSNALGTVNPVREMTRLAHRYDVPVLLDGAQAVPHTAVDVQDLDCDFYAFSGHKLFGPSGIGVLYGKANRLEAMQPYQGGGEMIAAVTFEKTFYKGLPHKFEAGTPNITGAVGLGAAIDYVHEIGYDAISAYEAELLAYATEAMNAIDGVRILGTAEHKASVLSFLVNGVHPHDVGTILDRHGIAVRVGHHCAQPVMQRFKIPATVRASMAFYNTKEEIDALAGGVRDVLRMFS